ncbi:MULTISPECIES: polyketide cyclase [unclassified Arthrobacter]|uniref:polyketide cyclase n=1 Tax=unclassified Arthrobacter TaxID=235627 RepID=UPI00149103B0|nr:MULTISPECIES: polyketide cyclase [unclassified Arthrobacter]MBE0010261.1 polyketide cyclase [Arthrobacter sp. AET 35A]NOJ64138.1 polyketide cyclase [Arthrobacter sp. 147(2020)]
MHIVDQEHVSASLRISASAPHVFAVLADPMMHSAIDGRSSVADGTGRIQQAVDQARLTEMGQMFRMGMNHPNHPEGNYQTVNKVHVFDPPRAIGWRTGHDPKGDGQLEFGGWFWRYDLMFVDQSETEVTLTYDWAAVPQSIREYLRFPPFAPERLTNSLQHLAELAAPKLNT